MIRSRDVFPLLLVVAASLLVIAGCGQQAATPSVAPTKQTSAPPSPAAVNRADVVLGAAFPLTGVGASIGKREAVGAQVAVDQINAAGGINGSKVKMVIMDTASNPQEAVNVVKKLASDEKVLAIIGPHYSSEAEVTFPLGNQLKIVQICVASSKPGLSKANRPFAFRNTVTENSVMDVVTKKLSAIGVKNVAIITDIKDAVSKSLGTDVIPTSVKAAGLNVLTGDNPITYQTGDTDFSAQITKLKALDPDAVGLGSLGFDALSIIIEARRQGMTARFFGGSPMFEGQVEKKGGKDSEGTIAGSNWWPGMPSEANKKFIDAYTQRVGQMYPGFDPEPLYYSVNAYDGVNMILEAVAKGGVTNKPEDLGPDRDRIREYLSKIKNFPGLGSKGFNEDGDGIKDIYALEIRNGTWAPVQ